MSKVESNRKRRMDESYRSSPVYVRRCLRCGEQINGYGYLTFYGILELANGTRLPACGEPLHAPMCPTSRAPRVPAHDSDLYAVPLSAQSSRRRVRNIAPGIDYNERTGKYAARSNKKRLGSHATREGAEAAIQNYLKNTHATAHRRVPNKRKQRKEKRHAISISNRG